MLSKPFTIIGITLGLVLTGVVPAAAQWWSSGPDPVCMQQAIRLRDEGLIADFNGYNVAINEALRSRSAAQVDAWGNTDAKLRQQLLNGAEKAFTYAYNEASRRLNIAKDQTRREFANAQRSCAVVPSGDYPSNNYPNYPRNDYPYDYPNNNYYSSSSVCSSVMCTMGVPDGCYRTQPRIINGCQVDCGQIVCRSYSSSFSSAYRCTSMMCPMYVPDGCYRTQPRIINGCQADCGQLICSSSSVSSSQQACPEHLSCIPANTSFSCFNGPTIIGPSCVTGGQAGTCKGCSSL